MTARFAALSKPPGPRLRPARVSGRWEPWNAKGALASRPDLPGQGGAGRRIGGRGLLSGSSPRGRGDSPARGSGGEALAAPFGGGQRRHTHPQGALCQACRHRLLPSRLLLLGKTRSSPKPGVVSAVRTRGIRTDTVRENVPRSSVIGRKSWYDHWKDMKIIVT